MGKKDAENSVLLRPVSQAQLKASARVTREPYGSEQWHVPHGKMRKLRHKEVKSFA